MATLTLNATGEEVTLSPEALREAGVKNGGPFRVEITPLPDAETIRMRALAYCVRKLGDALGARVPRWAGSEWVVDLKHKCDPNFHAQVFFNADGELIESKSATYESVRAIPVNVPGFPK